MTLSESFIISRNGDLRLEITLKLKLFDSVWATTYKFDLIPIPLEKVDKLESNVRDLEDKVAKCEEEVFRKPIYFHVTSTKSVGKNSVIPWNAVDDEWFKIDSSGEIEFLVSGVYMIHVVLRHTTTTSNGRSFSSGEGGSSYWADICVERQQLFHLVPSDGYCEVGSSRETPCHVHGKLFCVRKQLFDCVFAWLMGANVTKSEEDEQFVLRIEGVLLRVTYEP